MLVTQSTTSRSSQAVRPRLTRPLQNSGSSRGITEDKALQDSAFLRTSAHRHDATRKGCQVVSKPTPFLGSRAQRKAFEAKQIFDLADDAGRDLTAEEREHVAELL